MKEDKKISPPGSPEPPVADVVDAAVKKAIAVAAIIKARNAAADDKKLSLFDKLLNKSQLFCDLVTLSIRMLETHIVLQKQLLECKERLVIHERSLIDLYDRNGVVVEHVQASKSSGLDLRLPDIKVNNGEKPN